MNRIKVNSWIKFLLSLIIFVSGLYFTIDSIIFFNKAKIKNVTIKNIKIAPNPGRGGHKELIFDIETGKETSANAYFGEFNIGEKINIYVDPQNHYNIRVNRIYYFFSWGSMMLIGLIFLINSTKFKVGV